MQIKTRLSAMRLQAASTSMGRQEHIGLAEEGGGRRESSCNNSDGARYRQASNEPVPRINETSRFQAHVHQHSGQTEIRLDCTDHPIRAVGEHRFLRDSAPMSDSNMNVVLAGSTAYHATKIHVLTNTPSKQLSIAWRFSSD